MDRISKSLKIYEKQWEGEKKSLRKPVFEVKKSDKKIDYSFQELGLEMQDYFGKNKKGLIWSLFYKFREDRIRDAFIFCQKKGIKDISYLVGILKNAK